MNTNDQVQSFNNITPQDLISSKVLFGHLSKKWNPKMKKFILMKKNNLHILDPNKTLRCLSAACNYAKNLALEGKKILFVGTKQQAKSIVALEASKVNMPHVTERWLGGTLTNFVALRRLIKKWQSFERLMASPTYKNLTKKEQLTITREKNKLSTLLAGLSDVSRLPSAIFVVDINKENIAVKEAMKLGIPVIAVVDTNSDPDLVDVPIPANDDSVKSIELVVCAIASSIKEGIQERLAAKGSEISSKAPDIKDASSVDDHIGKVEKGKPNVKSFPSLVEKSEEPLGTNSASANNPKAAPKQRTPNLNAIPAKVRTNLPKEKEEDTSKLRNVATVGDEINKTSKKVTVVKQAKTAGAKTTTKDAKASTSKGTAKISTEEKNN